MMPRRDRGRGLRWMISGAVLLMLCSVPLRAQPRSGEGARQGQGLAPMEVQRLLDAYVIVQAQEALQLSDSQYPQFLAKLKVLQDVRRRSEQSRLRLVAELNRLSNRVDTDAREPQIRDRLQALDELEVSSAAELRKAREDVVETLNVRQRARFRVFEEQMERRKLQLLQRAQNRTRPLRP